MRFLVGVAIGVGLALCVLLGGLALALSRSGAGLEEVLSSPGPPREGFVPPLVLPSPSGKQPQAGAGSPGEARQPSLSATPTRVSPAITATATLTPTLAPTLTSTWIPTLALSPTPTVSLPTVTPIPAAPTQQGMPSLETFAAQVGGGDGHVPVGLYLPEHLAARVVSQPAGNPGFVPFQPDQVALFRLALQYDVLGFLAHNTLAGAAFFALREGDVFYVIYGDGEVQPFLVTRVLRYQALSPNSPYSEFIDLRTGERLTATQVFYRTYGAAKGGAVLQTCIAREGLANWGRLFLLARPLKP